MLSDSFVTVGNIADFVTGQGKMVVVNGRHVALFRLGDAFHAIDNLCLHRGGPLCDGQIDNDVVTCPWHAWRFKLCDGTWCDNPKLKIGSYPVRVEGDEIQVDVSET